MRFGVRDIANVVFKAKAAQKIGTMNFKPGQPVLYIDTAKTSSLEQATTTVYATGGRGNTRLIAWEGEKTLTFTVEDALLSPLGFAVLSGAGLIHNPKKDNAKKVHVHMTTNAYMGSDGVINLDDALAEKEVVCATAPIFIMRADADGSLTGEMVEGGTVDTATGRQITVEGAEEGMVFVDYYIIKDEHTTHELQIGAENFGGFYYVEADTLFRDQATGKDMPANLTIPNVKIQSNFTFSMAATGDPSTFTFTMDAFPGYTMFDKTKKVLCVLQIIDDTESTAEAEHSVMGHKTGFDIDESVEDSVVDHHDESDDAEEVLLEYVAPVVDDDDKEVEP